MRCDQKVIGMRIYESNTLTDFWRDLLVISFPVEVSLCTQMVIFQLDFGDKFRVAERQIWRGWQLAKVCTSSLTLGD